MSYWTNCFFWIGLYYMCRERFICSSSPLTFLFHHYTHFLLFYSWGPELLCADISYCSRAEGQNYYLPTVLWTYHQILTRQLFLTLSDKPIQYCKTLLFLFWQRFCEWPVWPMMPIRIPSQIAVDCKSVHLGLFRDCCPRNLFSGKIKGLFTILWRIHMHSFVYFRLRSHFAKWCY